MDYKTISLSLEEWVLLQLAIENEIERQKELLSRLEEYSETNTFVAKFRFVKSAITNRNYNITNLTSVLNKLKE